MKSLTPVNGTATKGTSTTRSAGGFDALLVGYVYGGSAGYYGTYAYFWSSSSADGSCAWHRSLGYDNDGMYRHNTFGKYSMFSVRCKKNDN
jgi:uncharacterized protein (TIGR02145 family)